MSSFLPVPLNVILVERSQMSALDVSYPATEMEPRPETPVTLIDPD